MSTTVSVSRQTAGEHVLPFICPHLFGQGQCQHATKRGAPFQCKYIHPNTKGVDDAHLAVAKRVSTLSKTATPHTPESNELWNVHYVNAKRAVLDTMDLSPDTISMMILHHSYKHILKSRTDREGFLASHQAMVDQCQTFLEPIPVDVIRSQLSTLPEELTDSMVRTYCLQHYNLDDLKKKFANGGTITYDAITESTFAYTTKFITHHNSLGNHERFDPTTFASQMFKDGLPSWWAEYYERTLVYPDSAMYCNIMYYAYCLAGHGMVDAHTELTRALQRMPTHYRVLISRLTAEYKRYTIV